jgi:DNA ligase-1
MTFSKLSEFFSKLEETSSRNSMTEILVELFSLTEPSEIGQVVYLTQGRTAPLFEPVEFGMAEKMVVKAIAQAFDKNVEQVTDLFKKNGDLGVVAEELSLKSDKGSGAKNTVSNVFEKLFKLTEISGEGSVEKKIGLLSEILSSVDSLSAKFIARIPVDKLRLGFSDMTIIDALSVLIDGSKKHKKVIEAAYNTRPDLGVIAKSVKENGVAEISHMKPKVGAPILVMRAERLTSGVEILEKTEGRCAVEPKLDGLRTQLHFKRVAENGKPMVRIFSRGLENVTNMYPDLIEAAVSELDCEEVILDGEAIGVDPKTGRYLPFQETVQRKRKYGISELSESVPLRLVTFDCLYLNGKSLIDEKYVDRRKILEEILSFKDVKDGKKLVVAEMKILDDANEIERMFQEQIKKGLEGILAKKLDGVYQAGARGWNWIKLKGSYQEKLSDTIDAVVMGIDYGQGKRNGFGVGAFLIGVYDKKTDTYKTISKVGTGLTDVEWKALSEHSKTLAVSEKPKNYDVLKTMTVDVWFKPKLVGEFKGDELTVSPMHTAGYALRFPRLVRWREKQPEDSTSLVEISEMSRLQKK